MVGGAALAAQLFISGVGSTAIVALVPVGFENAQDRGILWSTFESASEMRGIRAYDGIATSAVVRRFVRENRVSAPSDADYSWIRRQVGCTHLVVAQLVNTEIGPAQSVQLAVYSSASAPARTEVVLNSEAGAPHRLIVRRALELAGLWDRRIVGMKPAPRAATRRESSDRRRLTSAPVPPRPRRTGFAPIAVGWAMFGVGAIAAIPAGLLAADLNSIDGVETSPSLTILGVGGALMGVAGLVIALIGHNQLSTSGKRVRAWEAAYGARRR